MNRFEKSPAGRAGLLMLGLLLTVCFGLGPSVAATQADRNVFDDFAAEIDSDIAWTLGPTADRRPLRLAIWPHPTGPARLFPVLGEVYSDALLKALGRRGAAHFRFVDRENVATLADDADSSKAGYVDEAISRVLRHTDADVLLIGEFRQGRSNQLILSYKAIRVEDGVVLATTSQRRLEADSTIQEDSAPEELSDELRLANEHSPDVARPVGQDTVPLADHLKPLAAAPSAQVIRGVQQDLQNLGYDAGSVDGILGAQTRTAIRAYQRDSGLPADGRISIEFVENLNRDYVRLVEDNLSKPEPVLSEPEPAIQEPQVAQRRAIILPGWSESTVNDGRRWAPGKNHPRRSCRRCHQFPPWKSPSWNDRVRARFCPW